jgi:hypothetical protein
VLRFSQNPRTALQENEHTHLIKRESGLDSIQPIEGDAVPTNQGHQFGIISKQSSETKTTFVSR